ASQRAGRYQRAARRSAARARARSCRPTREICRSNPAAVRTGSVENSSLSFRRRSTPSCVTFVSSRAIMFVIAPTEIVPRLSAFDEGLHAWRRLLSRQWKAEAVEEESDHTRATYSGAVSSLAAPVVDQKGQSASMSISAIGPLAEVRPPPLVAVLPKADLHVHQEVSPRLDRVFARREGRAPYDWRRWTARMMNENPPGEPRLKHISSVQPVSVELDAPAENFVARVEDLLEE